MSGSGRHRAERCQVGGFWRESSDDVQEREFDERITPSSREEVVRWNRVAQLRARILCGTYGVPSTTVANSLLEDSTTAAHILPWLYSARE